MENEKNINQQKSNISKPININLSKNINNDPKLNYFTCKNCSELISIIIDPYNFSISTECDSCDKSTDIFFSTLNQLYSHKNYISQLNTKCQKCSSNENNQDINSNNNTQLLDQFAYCTSCKIHLCPLCIGPHLKSEKKFKKHNIILLGDITPSTSDIENSLELLLKKKQINDDIIKKLDNIRNTINNICFRIIKILKEEIKFAENYIMDFNRDFQNFHYLSNFNKIKEYISDFQNKTLEKFYNCNDIKQQVQILFDIQDEINKTSKQNKDDIIFKKIKKIGEFNNFNDNPFGELKFANFINIDFIQKDNSFILGVDNSLKIFRLLRSNSIILDYEFNFKTNMIDFILSKDQNEILVSESLKLHILTYDEKEKIFIFNSENDLNSENFKRINKIFQLNNGNLITSSDDLKLLIWIKNNENISYNKQKYSIIKIIQPLRGCCDFLQIDDNNFVIMMREATLKFFDCEEYNEIKSFKIENKGYLSDKKKHIVKINDNYLIAVIKNLYAVISIKTKELVQKYVLNNMDVIMSIDKYENYNNFVILIGKCADDEINTVQYKFDDYNFELIEYSNFKSKITKYGDVRFKLLNNKIIFRFYNTFSMSSNKKIELFI